MHKTCGHNLSYFCFTFFTDSLFQIKFIPSEIKLTKGQFGELKDQTQTQAKKQAQTQAQARAQLKEDYWNPVFATRAHQQV